MGLLSLGIHHTELFAMLMNAIIRKAQRFANRHHDGQKYGEEFPYMIHLQAVVGVLMRFGITETIILAAGWLHDVLEDTNVQYEELLTFFSQDIVNTVAPLSEPKGMTRKERHAVAYPRIRKNWRSLIVKLADRIAHLEAGGRKIQMYVKEHPDFKRDLYGQTEIPTEYQATVEAMWNYVDELIIETTHPNRIGFSNGHGDDT